MNRINTEVSQNLLVDPSFEEELEITSDGGTGGWRLFNNAQFRLDDPGGNVPNIPDAAFDGITMLSTFGPFANSPNASGAFQNVAAAEGEEFEASVVALTLSEDSIKDQDNFTLLSISFLDESGSVIQEAFASPEEMVDTNAKDVPILDGRDANLIEDMWVGAVVNAVAPAGTALARLSLFFVQVDTDSGAVWFDDASLIRLDPTFVPGPADFDKDGDVDGDDFLIWQSNFGTATGATPNTGDADDDGDVDGDDFLVWQANFGTGSGAGTGAAAVPEPAAAALLLTLLVMMGSTRPSH